MVQKFELSEGTRDTPLFRRNLLKAESELETFEAILKKINDNCLVFYQDGAKYLDSFRRMIDSFECLKLVLCDREEAFAHNKVKNFCSLLKEARQSEEARLNDTHQSITDKLTKYLDNDLKQMKEARKQFERISCELESAYQRNADVSKTRPLQCDEAERHLANVKKMFDLNAIDYIQQLNRFYSSRGNSILDTIQTYSQSMKSFYQCGCILLQEHENELTEISSDLFKANEKNLSQRRHDDLAYALQQQQQRINESSVANAINAGYLFKRTQNNTFKKWTRRWFTLKNSRLFYQKKSDCSETSQMEADLRVCKVREVNDADRRFVFELVSPKSRHLLQADSQHECNLWVQSIDKAINDALNNINSKYIFILKSI